MNYDKELYHKVITSINLVDHIAKTAELKNDGTERMECLCPLGGHEEKTPSFKIYIEKQQFYCFGCNRGGTVVEYETWRHGIEKNQALEKLCKEYSIPMDDGSIITNAGYARYKVANYYHNNLLGNAEALGYLRDRQVDADDITRFQIGLATGTAFKDFDGRIDRKVLEETGIIKKKNGSFEDYISAGILTIPIYNQSGNVSHFHLKHFKGKSDYQAMKEHRDGGLFFNVRDLSEKVIYIVEGPFEVIQLKKRGYNAIAVMGTPSEKQVKMLKGMYPRGRHHTETIEADSKTFMVWLDRDKNLAGQKRGEKLAYELSPFVKTTLCQCPDIGQDPDDFLRAGGDVRTIKYDVIFKRPFRIQKNTMRAGYIIEKANEPEELTDFMIEINYHEVHEDGTELRYVTIWNDLFKIGPIPVTSQDLSSVSKFIQFIQSYRDFNVYCTDKNWVEFKEYIFYSSIRKTVYKSKYYGRLKNGLWLWDNAAYDGEIRHSDNDGIIWLKNYTWDGIKSGEETDIDSDEPHERLVVPTKQKRLVEIVERLAYFFPRWIYVPAIGYIVATAFRQEIIREWPYMSLFMAYGRTQTGKSSLVMLCQSLMGAQHTPVSTCSTTNKAWMRHVARHKNLPIHLTEFDHKFIADMVNMFDLHLYSMARKSTDLDTLIVPVNSTVMFTTEVLPPRQSLLNRCVLLNYNRFVEKPHKKEEYDAFFTEMVNGGQGVGFLLDLLKTPVDKLIVRNIKGIEKAVGLLEPSVGSARTIWSYSVVYGAFAALYSAVPELKAITGEITQESMISDMSSMIREAEKLISERDQVRSFFSLLEALYVKGRLTNLVSIDFSEGNMDINMEGAFHEIISYDNRAQKLLDGYAKTDIEYRLKSVFENEKGYSYHGNIMRLPIACIEKMYGFEFLELKNVAEASKPSKSFFKE